jgi:serine/threonine protein kinase
MGEVFLAEDTSLNRKVALKFLPTELQQDAVAHKRLLREAHSAAALDHPYICSIHETAESEGKDFIVMEYVDGQTLQDRLAKGPLPLKEAIQIASEVAEALEEAHEKKIIHRDLKPSNITLTRKGHAKVMDFGLAKQLIPPGGLESQEESVTVLTRTGMTLGTLAYMSPEQLRGEALDARSDIFSFGVVLYEMLAGVHPFMKGTGIDTAGAILKDAPEPLAELRPDTPVPLQHIVKKMLAKALPSRYPSMHDVRTDLKELLEDSHRPAQPRFRRLRTSHWIAAAALTVVGAGIWTFFRFYPREAAPPPSRIVLVTTTAGEKGRPALSPDGSWVAFQWNGKNRDNWDIYVKELDGAGFNRLTADPAVDCCPAWSPDGRQIAFLRRSVD